MHTINSSRKRRIIQRARRKKQLFFHSCDSLQFEKEMRAYVDIKKYFSENARQGEREKKN